MLALLCSCSFLLSVTSGVQATEPLVTTKFGAVRGFLDKAVDGREFFAFKGIPFAEPPVGKLRFKVGLAEIIFLLVVVGDFGTILVQVLKRSFFSKQMTE